MTYKIKFSKNALKDYEKIKKSKLAKDVKSLLQIIESDPFSFPPAFEKLKGDLAGFYSRRINRQHRLVYFVKDDEIVITSMWTHYEKN